MAVAPPEHAKFGTRPPRASLISIRTADSETGASVTSPNWDFFALPACSPSPQRRSPWTAATCCRFPAADLSAPSHPSSHSRPRLPNPQSSGTRKTAAGSPKGTAGEPDQMGIFSHFLPAALAPAAQLLDCGNLLPQSSSGLVRANPPQQPLPATSPKSPNGDFFALSLGPCPTTTAVPDLRSPPFALRFTPAPASQAPPAHSGGHGPHSHDRR
jgi:hypothetical protein